MSYSIYGDRPDMSATANTDIVDRMQTLQKLVGTLLADRTQKLNVLTEIDRLRISIASAKNFPLTPLQMDSLEALARERQRGRDGKYILEKKYMAAQPTQPTQPTQPAPAEPIRAARASSASASASAPTRAVSARTRAREEAAVSMQVPALPKGRETDIEELKKFMIAKLEQMLKVRDAVSVRSNAPPTVAAPNPTTDSIAIKQRMQEKLAAKSAPAVRAVVVPPPVAKQKTAAEISAFRARLQKKRELEEAARSGEPSIGRSLPATRLTSTAADATTTATTTNTAAP